jgi:hypothetical protein
MILEPQQSGGLDYLGQMWTWVSGEAVAAATITGKWSDIELIHADRTRTAISSDRGRTAIHADRSRIEVQG